MPGGLLDSYRARTGSQPTNTYAPAVESQQPVDYDALDASSETTPSAYNAETGNGTGAALGAGALGVLGAYLAYKTGIGKQAITGAAKGLANLRMVSMLSGLAAPKSALGNAGAAFNVAMETGSMKPIKEQFSKQTAMDWLNEMRNPSMQANQSIPGASKWNPFGRLMGAGDVATQKSLIRTGLVPAGEAELQTLQAPLPPKIAHALESTPAKYAVPFRRTPINQAIEGGATITDAQAGSTVTRSYGAGPNVETYTANTRLPLAVHSAGGAVAGYASADSDYPVTPGVYAAFAGRYGLPSLMAAYLGRIAAGGKGGTSIVSSALPVAEYGISQSLDPRNILEPLDPSQSALVRTFRRINGER